MLELILAKMRFQVCCLRVALSNSLNLREIFRLSIGICSAKFTFLQLVLHKNQKTIISLTIICHPISVFLAIKCLKDSFPKRSRKPEKSEKKCRPSDTTRWYDFAQLTSNHIRSHKLRKLHNLQKNAKFK